ncbi:FAD-dependent oxidoreductase [Acinetobacter indicus]
MSCIQTGFQRHCHSTCSLNLVRSIRGMENAHILRPGYAIEYDYFNPQALKFTFGNQSG